MEKKYFIRVKNCENNKAQVTNENTLEIEWKLPENFQPKDTDWIALYVSTNTNNNYITYAYNSNSELEGSIVMSVESYQVNNKKLQIRYLPDSKYKSILVSDVFEVVPFQQAKMYVDEINEKQVKVRWDLPYEYTPDYYDWIGLFLKGSSNNDFLTWKYNSDYLQNGSFEFSLLNLESNIDQELVFRYLPNNGYQSIGESEPFSVKSEIPETNLIVSKDKYGFGEPIEVFWEFPEEFDMPTTSSWIGLYYENSANRQYIEFKYMSLLSKKGSMTFEMKDFQKINFLDNFQFRYFFNSYLIQSISKPFQIQFFENDGIQIISKKPSFGFPIHVQFKLPDGYKPNIRDSICLFDYDSGTDLNDTTQKPLAEKFNDRLSRLDVVEFSLDSNWKKKKEENQNQNENQNENENENQNENENENPSQFFIVKYISHPKNSEEKKVLITSSRFEVVELKDLNLSVSKNKVLHGDTVDVNWELPDFYNPTTTDWIGLYLKESTNDSFLTWQYNSIATRKGSLTFNIGDYITDKDQVFEFRYLPNNKYSSIAKSEEITVNEVEIKDFKLLVSKNPVCFGDSITVEWEFPESYNPTYADWIGLYLKGSPNNSFLTWQYNSSVTRKGSLTFNIGDYITNKDQVFEFRYLPNNQYRSLGKSDEIKVIPLEGGEINISSEKAKLGDKITISWQLPNNYEPNQNDHLIFFKSQFQSKDEEIPKKYQIIYQNEKSEKTGKTEIKVTFGDGLFEEEFIIGYYSRYGFMACQSPIIIEPTDFVGIKILNKRISVGDKIQAVWSLPSIFTPLENDKITVVTTKESRIIPIANSISICNVGSISSENGLSPLIKSESFPIESRNVSNNLQTDLFNLFLRQEFCDFTINYSDGNIQVHKLILLMRFDNDQFILEKIQEVLSTKTKKQVIPFLIFIYTGMIDPSTSLDLNQFQKDEWNFIEENHPFFSFYWKQNQFNFEDSDSQEFFQKYLESSDDFVHLQNLNKIQVILQELGFDQNWIQNKKEEAGIKNDLLNLYLEKIEKKDFGIVCNDSSEIKVHKLILIARSNLFRGMFLSVKDDSNSVNDYSEKSKESLEQLIYFFYFGEFDLNLKGDSTKIIQELKDTEDFYQLSPFTPFYNRLKEF
ncbi:hypothetical protein M0811_09249 [Anaeramoeba ignava]|uniref:BTB domain-containing protein n=1 Tax=Anaeramoeba ignava TaxID=1746090 RepID=A0A9Q0LK05_ANAIG|nr:hypothetical protein M0811_09249 [Anaeramoeba ignava]